MDNSELVAQTASRIFRDHADAQEIILSGNEDWRVALWSAIEGAALPAAFLTEEQGGFGETRAEVYAAGFAVLREAGRSALAVPLAETMLAVWLLAQAGMEAPGGAMSVAPADPRDRIRFREDGSLEGRARRVPFGMAVDRIAVLASRAGQRIVALVDPKDCTERVGRSLALDPTPTLTFDGVQPIAQAPLPDDFDPQDLMQMGVAARAALISGALETVLDLSVRYATERVAFGRPIGKFQAVQHMLARLGGETAAAVSAACSAADALATGQPAEALLLEVAAAKIRCGEAAETGTLIAHQVHGAIGISDEHVLHRYTLRALAWREDFGGESHWALALGRAVCASGTDALWPLLASR
ncbi:acyl-CoA dehydrogenase family protein [Paracoccus sp. S1E-3]|uniref:acyl-CoA dehydrogenase family protein n=1 Tax=Paracoccus sp. S1E-3 TaxID=2756130 RepID=UPI001C68942C|nr:acyl-CoA dehydrogenase family protein [Paracoccus sp. S1E-3]